MRQQRSGGGIADPHLAETDHPTALISQRTDDGRAAGQRGIALGRAHRRPFEIVARSESDLGVDQTGARAEVMCDAGVYDLQLQAVVAGENIDRCAAGKKVFDHLPGHLLRECRNAGARCAVVAREDQQVRMLETRRQGLLYLSDLQCQTFELTQ
jgi:hypothetical protein